MQFIFCYVLYKILRVAQFRRKQKNQNLKFQALPNICDLFQGICRKLQKNILF